VRLSTGKDAFERSKKKALSRYLSKQSLRLDSQVDRTKIFHEQKDALAAVLPDPQSYLLQNVAPTVEGLKEIDVMVAGQHLIRTIPEPTEAIQKLRKIKRQKHEARKVFMPDDFIDFSPSEGKIEDLACRKTEVDRLRTEVEMETFREQKVAGKIKELEKMLEDEQAFLKEMLTKQEEEAKYRDMRKKRFIALEKKQMEKRNMSKELAQKEEAEKKKLQEEEQKRMEEERLAIKAKIAEWKESPRIPPTAPKKVRPRRPPTVREQLMKERIDYKKMCENQRPAIPSGSSSARWTRKSDAKSLRNAVEDLSNQYGLNEMEKRKISKVMTVLKDRSDENSKGGSRQGSKEACT
jgi:hypothetical protein